MFIKYHISLYLKKELKSVYNSLQNLHKNSLRCTIFHAHENLHFRVVRMGVFPFTYKCNGGNTLDRNICVTVNLPFILNIFLNSL